MSVFKPKYKYLIHPEKGIQIKIDEDLNNFNVDLLKLGDLNATSKAIEAISVMFDLEGFTNFTRQVDPQLTIPNFISDFFNWLFKNIIDSITEENKNTLLAELPFFSKFMGDGVLFLWKIDLDKIVKINKKLGSEQLHGLLQKYLCNIISVMHDTCIAYEQFLNSIKTNYVDPPTKLRCGIARGNVFSIGNGLDFVGPCINASARLQNIGGLSFAISARGIKLDGFNDVYRNEFIKKRVNIIGVGENELIYVFKKEFERLPKKLKGDFFDI